MCVIGRVRYHNKSMCPLMCNLFHLNTYVMQLIGVFSIQTFNLAVFI